MRTPVPISSPFRRENHGPPARGPPGFFVAFPSAIPHGVTGIIPANPRHDLDLPCPAPGDVDMNVRHPSTIRRAACLAGFLGFVLALGNGLASEKGAAKTAAPSERDVARRVDAMLLRA